MTLRISTVVLLVAVVLVGFFLVPQWQDLREARQQADDHVIALDVATAQVTELTTLDTHNLDDRLQSLNGRLTEEFSQQFQAMYSTFASVVNENEVSSVGSVLSAGLVSSTNSEAVVIVAARAEVTSPEQEEATQRSYRFEVTLVKQGSQWLISEMRFVA